MKYFQTCLLPIWKKLEKGVNISKNDEVVL